MLELTNYDFVDFGSSKGGCIEFALRKLGGTCPLGVEINKAKANVLVKKGYSCILGDVTKISMPKKSVKFTTMCHFLEHLNSLDDVHTCIKLALSISTDFIFIEGPSFDFDKYLKKYGYKFFWADWTGHKTHVTTQNIKDIFINLGIKNYTLLTEIPYIVESSSKDIHPINSKKDQFEYNVKIHPKKVYKRFDRQLFRSFICFGWVTRPKNSTALLQARAKFITRETSV